MKNSQLKKRLELAIAISESVGQAILKFREHNSSLKVILKSGGQLKSPIDIAAESWIISLLKAHYPRETILSEEKYETIKKFNCKDSTYWAIDALDGTKSYHAGYKGFCTQIAFIENGKLQLSVVYAPDLSDTYWAIDRKGAYFKHKNKAKRIFVRTKLAFKKTYIDNQPAKGMVAKILKKINANKFFELGSYGLKICKVAEGKADIFLKPGEFKIWDTAPGDLILREAGGKLTLWSGEEIDYSGRKIYFKNLLATNSFLHRQVLSQIKYFHKNY